MKEITEKYNMNLSRAALAGFVIMGFIATISAGSPGKSIIKLLSFVVGLGLFYWITCGRYWNDRRLWVFLSGLILAATVLSSYGVLEYLYKVYLGLPLDGFRAKSFTKNPNSLAKFLIPFVPLCAALGLVNSDKRYKILYLCVTMLMVVAILFTMARGAWLSICLAGIMFATVFRFYKTGMAMAFVLIIGFFAIPDNIAIERLVTLLDMKMQSNSERLYLWEAAVNIIRDYPLMGIGLNNFELVYPLYKQPGAIVSTYGHAHNTFLNIAVETGITGFLFFALFVLSGIYTAFRCPVQNSNAVIGQSLIIGLICLYFYGLFEYIFNNELQLVLVFVLTGIAEGFCRSKSGADRL